MEWLLKLGWDFWGGVIGFLFVFGWFFGWIIYLVITEESD